MTDQLVTKGDAVDLDLQQALACALGDETRPTTDHCKQSVVDPTGHDCDRLQQLATASRHPRHPRQYRFLDRCRYPAGTTLDELIDEQRIPRRQPHHLVDVDDIAIDQRSHAGGSERTKLQMPDVAGLQATDHLAQRVVAIDLTA